MLQTRRDGVIVVVSRSRVVIINRWALVGQEGNAQDGLQGITGSVQ